MQRFVRKIGHWLLPFLCCLCGDKTNTNRDLCSVCRATLPWAEDRCYRCGLRMHNNHLSCCQTCIDNPPAFDRVCTLFSYDAPVTKLVTGLKFGRQLAYGRILGDMLADAVLNDWYQDGNFPEAVIPMPLHAKRLKTRGYNQSLELAWPITKRSKITLLSQVVKRIRSTKPQSGLNAEQRRHNVSKAFAIPIPLMLEHVAILDDVVTTGNTVSELCMALKQAGVLQVDVWCICRA